MNWVSWPVVTAPLATDEAPHQTMPTSATMVVNITPPIMAERPPSRATSATNELSARSA